MSNETAWPTKPFYIMSKIGRSNWSLTIIDGAVKLAPLSSQIDQIWTATPDPRGGAVLRHVQSGKVLACGMIQLDLLGISMTMPGGPLKAADLDTADPTQLWRVGDVGDNWREINALLNWESKVNVYGSDVHGTIGVYKWDGGADNEEWRLVEELGTITVDSVTYDQTKAVGDLGRPPSHCAAVVINNIAGGTANVTTQTLTRQVTTSRSVTHSQSETIGHKYTQTIGVKGGIEKVIEISASLSFEESDSKTISLTDQKTTTETVTDTVTTQVNVPAGRKYSYHVVVYYGAVSVPYTARLTFQSTNVGAAPVHFTTTGVFNGVNTTSSEIVIMDVTEAPAPGAMPRIVATIPVA